MADLREIFDLYARVNRAPREKISHAAKIVFGALLLTFHNRQTGRCNPGIDRLVKTTGVSRAAVCKAIGELKRAGFITYETNDGGRNRSNSYRFPQLDDPTGAQESTTVRPMINRPENGRFKSKETVQNSCPKPSKNPGETVQLVDPNKGSNQEKNRTIDRSFGEIEKTNLTGVLADEGIIAAFGGVKIPALLFNPSDLRPIHELLAEGCDLGRDIAPAVANFVKGLKSPLRSLAAGPIREKALASRDRVVQRPPLLPAGTFVVEGTPAWRAWLRAKGLRSHFVHELQSDRTKRGCYFDSEWPPGWDEERLDAAESAGALLETAGRRSIR